MNRRHFIEASTVGTVSLFAVAPSLNAEPATAALRNGPALCAYYLNANMYTIVPRQVREDMMWMARLGTSYLGLGIVEQDLWAARENISLIIDEAERAGIRVIAVPSRWGGLVAGAPKVPSMFSVVHPHTWMQDERGSTHVAPQTSGVISSIHWPETLDFFCNTLMELFKQHPRLAGFSFDEPKMFRIDHSPRARKVLGRDAPHSTHYAAAGAFLEKICLFFKERWPDKLTFLMEKASSSAEKIEICARLRGLDYLGADGRPWGKEADRRWEGRTDSTQESGTGKILLDGGGAAFITSAREHGKKSFLLIENHNLTADMLPVLEEGLPDVLDLGADLVMYYYYPRNVTEPDRAMAIIADALMKKRIR